MAGQMWVAFTGQTLAKRCDTTQATRAQAEGNYVTTAEQWAADLRTYGVYTVSRPNGRRVLQVTQAAAVWTLKHRPGLIVRKATATRAA
jgi:hypothetical protein